MTVYEKVVTSRVPAPLAERLKEYARADDRPVGTLIRRLLAASVAQLDAAAASQPDKSTVAA